MDEIDLLLVYPSGRNLVGIILNPIGPAVSSMCLHETKYCPRCTKAFECKAGNIAQCQCSGVQLTTEQRAFIEQRYTDCLCNDCLQQLQNQLECFKEKYIFR